MTNSSKISVLRDLPFLEETRAEKMDLYLPAAGVERKGRAIVIIHGGGWRVCDKADARETGIAETLAGAGYVCASINYQMATPDRCAWPVCMEDCRQAVRYFRQNAAQYDIDPARIGAIGGSAGGNMSLLLGLPDTADHGSQVQAVAAFYPVTDLLTTPWDAVQLFGVSRDADPDLHKSMSPLFLVEAGFPPTLLIHGTNDKTVPHDQSERLAAAMDRLGIDHRLILVPGAPHTFPIQGEHGDFRDEVVGFFDRVLKP